MSTEETYLTLILPAYCPKGEWWVRVEQLLEVLKRATNSEGLAVRLLICPDGSYASYTQESLNAIERLKQIYPVGVVEYEVNRGKGAALREGVRTAMSDVACQYVIYTDYDIPFTEDSYLAVLDTLLAGYEVVTADRGASYKKHLKGFRRVLSWGSKVLNRLFLDLPVSDTQGGLKGFTREGAKAFLATSIESFLFDTEFIAIATRRKLKITSVPVEVKESGLKLSKMGWRIASRELRHFTKVIKSRWF